MTSVTEVFDQPCRWRVEAARALGVPDDQMSAVLSPGASYPVALKSMADALPTLAHVLIDIGAGAGGASEWLRRATGATVIAVEPSSDARQVAGSCFPELVVVDGRANETGLPDRCGDVITLCGVCSLIDDIDPVLDEVARLAVPGAMVAITDLFAYDHRIVSAPNVFRSIDETVALLRNRGWSVLEIGCGSATVGARWANTAAQIDAWIAHHCADRPGFAEWMADRDHLQAHIDRGDVLACSIVAEVGDQGRR